MGPGGMGQSGGHAPSNLNDSMAPGLPPTSMMQSQMSNGESNLQMCILLLNCGPPGHCFLIKLENCYGDIQLQFAFLTVTCV